MPILINPIVKIGKLHKGDIMIHGTIRKAMIVIGFQGSKGRCNNKSFISVNRGAHVIFNGYVRIAKGCTIIVNNGELSFGDNVRFNGNCLLICCDKISFADDVICGWNVQFLTNNGHVIIIDGVQKDMVNSIYIGKHVWIGSDSVIGKGVSVSNGCVIAHHAIVTKSIEEENCLYGGFPAKKLKTNVIWKS